MENKQTKKKPDYKLVCVYILLQKLNKDGFRENVHKKTYNNRLAGYLVFFLSFCLKIVTKLATFL